MTNKLRELIESRMEPTEPQNSILALLKAREGKRIDKRLIAMLNTAVPGHDIRLSLQYGMAKIAWGGWGLYDSGDVGGALFLSGGTKNLCVNTADILERNCAYFSALVERNEKRRAALNSAYDLRILEEAINAYIQARDRLKERLSLDCFSSDNSAIEKAYGIELE